MKKLFTLESRLLLTVIPWVLLFGSKAPGIEAAQHFEHNALSSKDQFFNAVAFCPFRRVSYCSQSEFQNNKIESGRILMKQTIDPSVLISRRDVLIASAMSGFGGLNLWNTIRRVNSDNDKDKKIHEAIFHELDSPLFHDILEIGVGDAVNMQYYNSGMHVVGIDPEIHQSFLEKERRKLKEKRNIEFEYAKGSAETLPFPDSSFDAVVGTLVMCTIPDPLQALKEVSRVLKQGGKYIFIEHILADEANGSLRDQQEFFNNLQQLLAGGCHLTRETDKLLLSNTASQNSETNYLFSKVNRYEVYDLNTRWPICHHIAGVLVK